MSFFIICVRKIYVSVKCSQIEYILRLLLASRGVLYIPWGFWFCFLLLRKVTSKYKVNFLHFFPFCPRYLNRFHIPTEGSSAVLLPVDTQIFTLLSCKPLGIMDAFCGEMMTLCWLTFVKISLYQPELVLFCPSQVCLYRKPMPHVPQVVCRRAGYSSSNTLPS